MVTVTHTKQNTHVHTEKEEQSSKRAISQTINQRINQTLKRQTDKPTDKQTDRQTNKKTTKETKEQRKKQTTRTTDKQRDNLTKQTKLQRHPSVEPRSTDLRNRLRGMSHTNLHLAIASLVYASWAIRNSGWVQDVDMNCWFKDLFKIVVCLVSCRL